MVRWQDSSIERSVNKHSMTIVALFTMILFGTGFWGIVIVLEDIPPVTLGFLRASFVASFMIILFIISGYLSKNKWMMSRDNLLKAGVKGKHPMLIVVLIGLFSTVIPNIFQNIGMTIMDPSSTSSLTALIQGVGPVFTIVLAVLLLKERMDIWKVVGLIIAVPATVVLTTYGSSGFDIGSKYTLGALLNILTAISYSISGILLKTALNRGGKPLHLVWVNSFYGTILFLPLVSILWIFGIEPLDFFIGISITTVLALFYISIGLYGITAVIWYRVIRSGDLSRITFFIFLLPVFSYLVGFLLLDERLNLIQVLTGAILLIGVGLSQVGRKNGNNPRSV